MSLPPVVVTFLTGSYEYAAEFQALGMAFQGAMAVRNGANKDGKMHWFHAFALTTMLAFGGGWLGFMLMGKPTSMVSGGDINVPACAFAFIVVNFTPFDIGYRLLSFLPFKILITVFAQLFRSGGMIKFINTAFSEIKPTRYYPIPVVGPVVYGTMLGNMGGLVLKGLDGYLKNGMPWPFQNGIFIGTFYHLYSNDTNGPLGKTLRNIFKLLPVQEDLLGLDDRTFAHLVTASFMQVAGIAMLPQFFGPTFSPIASPIVYVHRVASGRALTSETASEPFTEDELDETLVPSVSNGSSDKKKKRRKNKGKVA